MNTLTLLTLTSQLFFGRRVRRPARRPAPLLPLPELIDGGAEAPAGCGWFDSSHTLQHGLLVTEHAGADAVTGELALEGWLELQLSGWRPVLRQAA